MSVAKFLLRLGVVDPSPIPVRPTVRSDGHAGGEKFPDTVVVQPARHAEKASEDEEFRSQTTFDQARQGDVDVGSIPVVEGDADVIATDRGIEHKLELGGVNPGPVLARVEGANGRTYSVHGQVDDRRG